MRTKALVGLGSRQPTRRRRARAGHRRHERWPAGERAPWGRPLDDIVVQVHKSWTYVGTGYALASIPMLILFILFSKQFVEGLTSGSLKW